MGSVKKVNVTKGNSLTIYHETLKANTKMSQDVEKAINQYYSFASDKTLPLKHATMLCSLLSMHPKEQKLIQSAIESYSRGNYRNSYDDYRLCIEMLVRNLLKESAKGLENLLGPFCAFLSSIGYSKQLYTIIHQGLDYFCKYQNASVKHNINISIVDMCTILTWANMILEQIIIIETIKKP